MILLYIFACKHMSVTTTYCRKPSVPGTVTMNYVNHHNDLLNVKI